jgi:hypothetical protein
MAEAFAAAGGVVATPTIVLLRIRRLASSAGRGRATDRAEALRLWDAVVALAAVPSVLDLSRPRPPRPEVPGLCLPQP